MKRTINARTFQLNRRTFLRSSSRATSTVCALPLLEAMFPNESAYADAPWELPRVFGFYVPNGINEPLWFPDNDRMDLTGTALEQFQVDDLKADISLYQGMSNASYVEKSTGNGHLTAIASWFTGVGIQPGPGQRDADMATRHRMSLDQEVALNAVDKIYGIAPNRPSPDKFALRMAGNSELDPGRMDYNNAMKNALNWSVYGTILPLISDLRWQFYALYGRQFGRGYEHEDEILLNVLNDVKDDFKRLEKRLGYDDRRRLDWYANNLMEIERKIFESEKIPPTNKRCIIKIDPKDIPDTPNGSRVEAFGAHMKIAADILAHVMSCGLVYGSSYCAGGEYSGALYKDVIDRPRHYHNSISSGNPGEDMAKIDRFHADGVAHFIKKMKQTPMGEGTVLDNTAIVFGSGMGSGNRHTRTDIAMLVGGRFGKWKHGRHHKLPGENHAKVINTIREELGIRPLPQYSRVPIS